MNGPRRLLVVSLLALLVLLIIRAHLTTIWVFPRAGIDVQIPLHAAERWMSGGLPYDPDAFRPGQNANPPFLYPPVVLPFFAALSAIPRTPVVWGVVLLMAVAAVTTTRRLWIPWLWIPLVIAWPPFFEGILSANLAILMFLAFVVLFYRGEGAPAWRPPPRDVSRPDEPEIEIGALSAAIAVIKVSQPHAWLFVLRNRPRAAVIGAVAAALLVLATVPLTGIQLWFDWIDQLRRASDPMWDLAGIALPRFLSPGIGLLVAIVCVVAVWFVPRRDPAPWLGILSTVGSLSTHTFGLLYLIPAMLTIRLEISLVAACMIATYSDRGQWAGIILVSGSYALSAVAHGRLRSWLNDTPASWPVEAIEQPANAG